MTQFNFEAIGTSWQIDLYQKLSETEENKILLQIKNRIEIFDKTYSRFRDDSLVTKISKEAGTFIFPKDAQLLMSVYYTLYKTTNGLFTPLVGDILSDAGYDAKYSLKQKNKLRAAQSWNEIIEYKYPNLKVKKPVLLDFGAGGKGYLVDLVAKLFEENNIFEYCIDAGGDILHKNKTGTRVGLENPENIKQVIGIYNLRNESICGSAHNRRAWGDFSHIINPKTLESPKNILAVWVVADTTFIADAIATCLFFVKASALSNTYKFEYLIIYKDKSLEKSDKFNAEIFVA